MSYSKVIGTLFGLMTLSGNATEELKQELAESDEGAVRDCAIILLQTELPINKRYDDEFIPRILSYRFGKNFEVLLELAKVLHKGEVLNYEIMALLKENLYKNLYKSSKDDDMLNYYDTIVRIMTELRRFIEDEKQVEVLQEYAAGIIAAWGSIEQVRWTISLLKQVGPERNFAKECILQGLVFSSRRFPQLKEEILEVVLDELNMWGNLQGSRYADLTHACVTVFAAIQHADLFCISIKSRVPYFYLEKFWLELARSKSLNVRFALVNYCFVYGNISEFHRKIVISIYENAEQMELRNAAIKALENMISKDPQKALLFRKEIKTCW